MIYKLLTMLLLISVTISAQTADPPDTIPTENLPPPPAPVTNLKAVDKPNDHGHAIIVTWDPSVDEIGGSGAQTVTIHEVYRWEPFWTDTVSRVRQMQTFVRAGESPLKVDQDSAQIAKAAVARGMLDLSSLSFVPALPPDFAQLDSATQLATLARSLQDTLDAMAAPWEITKDTTKAYRRAVLDAIDQLSGKYAAYPDPTAGRWVYLGTGLLGQYEQVGAKERFANTYFPDFTDYYYRVDAVTSDENVFSTAVYGPVQSRGQWFNTSRTVALVFVVALAILILVFVSLARRGSNLYVRTLAGIDAVDEAIGRATEMGRPILYVLGLGTAADVATIASFSILGRVAKQVAEYQTPLMVPTYDPIVMTVAQEVVKSSYLDAGRPDDYDDDKVYFVTQSQFAYVAAVNGAMLRELPATNIYMGKFFAESLLLAETGAVAGSIQIAGTDEIAQIPFFIVACDYTLIGEELYAASAYLSREPILLGSLKAQDYMKAAVIIFAVVGLIAANADWDWFVQSFKIVE